MKQQISTFKDSMNSLEQYATIVMTNFQKELSIANLAVRDKDIDGRIRIYTDGLT